MIFFQQLFFDQKKFGNFCVSSVNPTDFINILHPGKKKKKKKKTP
jgi:hypothetical protein